MAVLGEKCIGLNKNFSIGFQTFGIVFGLSDAILGLTFLAWGNSIGGEYNLVLFFV